MIGRNFVTSPGLVWHMFWSQLTSWPQKWSGNGLIKGDNPEDEDNLKDEDKLENENDPKIGDILKNEVGPKKEGKPKS